MICQFNNDSFIDLCDVLAKRDNNLKWIIDKYGYPPMWKRDESFETLLLIILEQQVSLASARAAYKKLEDFIGLITPKKLLALTDVELKNCYFSRQKIAYTRHLATNIEKGKLNLSSLRLLPDDAVRATLMTIKGIGNWTAEVYMMFALQRSNCFPKGDIALQKAMRELKGLDKNVPIEQIVQLEEEWAPYKTIGAFLLWHFYLSKRGDVQL